MNNNRGKIKTIGECASTNWQVLAELARPLETSWPAAKRLENPRHYPTMKQLEKAAAAMGKRLVLAFE